MKKPLLEIKKIWDIYNNPKDYYRFNYIGQEINIFFGKNILHKHLKEISCSKPLKILFEDIDSIKTLKNELEKDFPTKEDSNLIISLGGAVAINKGKILRNENKNSRLIIVPTTCANDGFFTNRYKKDKNSASTALSGLMPDFLIVDTEMIKKLVTEDMIYAGWGEFLSLIASYNDWKENNKGLIEKDELELLDKLVDKMFKDARDFFEKEDDINKSVDILMHLLFMKCLFMMIYDDNSIGASSDHMFAYSIEGLGYCDKLRHGQKVLFGAIVSSGCYSIINGNGFVDMIPKKIVDYVVKEECFKKILNPQDLKVILDKALVSRNRKTILNKIHSDHTFYNSLVKEIKNV
ncbi:MAG: iron-containing alcohol dehydrogenase [Nanoarchaeota archaeon]|nr:iron-containing alcohol dehydrogenase [Nanoarchaeota archaeon]